SGRHGGASWRRGPASVFDSLFTRTRRRNGRSRTADRDGGRIGRSAMGDGGGAPGYRRTGRYLHVSGNDRSVTTVVCRWWNRDRSGAGNAGPRRPGASLREDLSPLQHAKKRRIRI